MKLNKRVLASAALSVSLATTAVAPVAWADDDAPHLRCNQNFRVGSDFDADANGNVAEHLRRNCKMTAEQISKLNIEDLKSVAKELKKADGSFAIGPEETDQISTEQVNYEAEINEAADNAEEPGGNPGAGEKLPKPPADDENLPKPPFPGGDAGESSSDLGSIFGVITGLAGLAALVASVAKIFNHGLGLFRILQPLRDFLAQFSIKF